MHIITEFLPENKILTKIMWFIYYEPIDSIEIHEGDYEYKNPEQNFFNKVIIKKNNTKNKRYLVLPIQRFAKNYKVILLPDEKITVGELFTIIYNFYNQKILTYEEIKELNDDDVFDYVNNACINHKRKNKDIKYIDIMGDKRIYEFIYVSKDKSGDVQYLLSLGS